MPLLTQPAFADFTQNYGALALKATASQRLHLAVILVYRGVRFGCERKRPGIVRRWHFIFGQRNRVRGRIPATRTPPFVLQEVLRTPYRIDQLQPLYFVLEELDELYRVMDADLLKLIEEAKTLGDHPPRFDTSDLIDD